MQLLPKRRLKRGLKWIVLVRRPTLASF